MKQKIKDILDWTKEKFLILIPVLFATGIIIYFSFQTEPNKYVTLAVLELLVLLIIILRRFQNVINFLLMLLIAVLGFAYMQLRTIYLTPKYILDSPQKLYLTGTVKEQYKNENQKPVVVLENVKDFYEKYEFAKVKIVLPKRTKNINMGQCVDVVAKISKPNMPIIPNAFQYNRKLFFEKIEATGYSIAHPTEAYSCKNNSISVIEKYRKNVSDKIHEILNKKSAGVVEAISIGNRNNIDLKVNENYQKSGLAHFISISGMHMSMLAGIVFMVVRFLMALFPCLSLNYDSRKVASVFSLIFTFLYLLISGFAVPTIRAFVMIAIVLLGIFVGRRAISLKNLSLAAMLILFIMPEAIISPAFCLSFAAVVALIAIYGRYGASFKKKESFAYNLMNNFKVVCCTTLVASLATAPFIAYFFNRISLWSVLANVLATPIIALWIMPLLLMAMLFYPFGADYYLWKMLGVGIDWINAIAQYVSSLSYSVINLPGVNATDLGLFYGGVLLIWLIKTKLRFLGYAFVGLSLALMFNAQTPDMILSSYSNQIAIKDNDGKYAIWPVGRRNKFFEKVVDNKYEISNLNRKDLKKIINGKEKSGAIDLRCNREFCIYKNAVQIYKNKEVKINGSKIMFGANIYLNPLKIVYVTDVVGKRPWN